MSQTLPERLKPWMSEEDLIPPTSKTYPRTAWVGGIFLIPPFNDASPIYDATRLHWAAHHASKEWAEKVAKGEHIDHDCFLLAVVDKIIEDMRYHSQRRLLGFEERFPTYVEWRQYLKDLIRTWYWVGYYSLPEGNPQPPSYVETHKAICPAITTLFRRGLDADVAPKGRPPRYDRALLGRFDPNNRELPPVTRIVRPLQLRDGEAPSSGLDPDLEALSEQRRGRNGHKMNVVNTIVLPAVPVDMSHVDVSTKDSTTTPPGPMTSHPGTSSSPATSDTEIALETPVASAESSPQGKAAKAAARPS